MKWCVRIVIVSQTWEYLDWSYAFLAKGVLVDDNICLMYIFYILNVLFPVINMAHPHIILSNVVREHKNYYYYSLIINTAGTAATWMGGSKNIH